MSTFDLPNKTPSKSKQFDERFKFFIDISQPLLSVWRWAERKENRECISWTNCTPATLLNLVANTVCILFLLAVTLSLSLSFRLFVGRSLSILPCLPCILMQSSACASFPHFLCYVRLFRWCVNRCKAIWLPAVIQEEEKHWPPVDDATAASPVSHSPIEGNSSDHSTG